MPGSGLSCSHRATRPAVSASVPSSSSFSGRRRAQHAERRVKGQQPVGEFHEPGRVLGLAHKRDLILHGGKHGRCRQLVRPHRGAPHLRGFHTERTGGAQQLGCPCAGRSEIPEERAAVGRFNGRRRGYSPPGSSTSRSSEPLPHAFSDCARRSASVVQPCACPPATGSRTRLRHAGPARRGTPGWSCCAAGNRRRWCWPRSPHARRRAR